jgi:hypothetical protein
LAARVTYWDAPWPSAHICLTHNPYQYNPNPLNGDYSEAFDDFSTTPCNEPGSAAVSNDAYIYVYGSGWIEGGVITSFVNTNP